MIWKEKQLLLKKHKVEEVLIARIKQIKKMEMKLVEGPSVAKMMTPSRVVLSAAG